MEYSNKVCDTCTSPLTFDEAHDGNVCYECASRYVDLKETENYLRSSLVNDWAKSQTTIYPDERYV